MRLGLQFVQTSQTKAATRIPNVMVVQHCLIFELSDVLDESDGYERSPHPGIPGTSFHADIQYKYITRAISLKHNPDTGAQLLNIRACWCYCDALQLRMFLSSLTTTMATNLDVSFPFCPHEDGQFTPLFGFVSGR